jgi:hypothetical protein
MLSISKYSVIFFVTCSVIEAFFSVQHRWQSRNQRIDGLNSRGIISSSSALCQSSSSDSKTIPSISQELNPGNTSAFLDFDGRNHHSNYLAFDIKSMKFSPRHLEFTHVFLI